MRKKFSQIKHSYTEKVLPYKQVFKVSSFPWIHKVFRNCGREFLATFRGGESVKYCDFLAKAVNCNIEKVELKFSYIDSINLAKADVELM